MSQGNLGTGVHLDLYIGWPQISFRIVGFLIFEMLHGYCKSQIGSNRIYEKILHNVSTIPEVLLPVYM